MVDVNHMQDIQNAEDMKHMQDMKTRDMEDTAIASDDTGIKAVSDIIDICIIINILVIILNSRTL